MGIEPTTVVFTNYLQYNRLLTEQTEIHRSAISKGFLFDVASLTGDCYLTSGVLFSVSRLGRMIITKTFMKSMVRLHVIFCFELKILYV